MARITYIEFNGTSHSADVAPGQSVMEGAVRNGIPGIEGIDTRALTKKLRVRGALKGFISTEEVSEADAVARAMAEAGGDLLESVSLFDVYRGEGVAEGRRSLAFRLRFCALDRTLTDQEVGALRLACIEAAGSAVGATLR